MWIPTTKQTLVPQEKWISESRSAITLLEKCTNCHTTDWYQRHSCLWRGTKGALVWRLSAAVTASLLCSCSLFLTHHVLTSSLPFFCRFLPQTNLLFVFSPLSFSCTHFLCCSVMFHQPHCSLVRSNKHVCLFSSCSC